MLLNTRIVIDVEPLNKLLEQEKDLRSRHTMLLMNSDTFYALACTRLTADKSNKYRGFDVIKEETLPLGEVVVLSDYEKAKENATGLSYEQDCYTNLCSSDSTRSIVSNVPGDIKVFNSEK